MKFKAFDPKDPPSNGLYWLDVFTPETDVDVDGDGNTIGWNTDQTVRRLGLAFIDNTDDNGIPFLAMPVDRDLCGTVGELSTIAGYAVAALPDLPGTGPTDFEWFPFNGAVDKERFGTARWFWVAVKNDDLDHRHVTLAYHEVRDDQVVAGFDSPEHTYFPLHELYVGDIVTHIAPLSIPSYPITIEAEPSEDDSPHQSLQLLSESLAKLYAISTGQILHVYNGSCPDATEGAHVRDDECPACNALVEAEKNMKYASRKDLPSSKET